jgi:CRP-like cAMP-binding protein
MPVHQNLSFSELAAPVRQKLEPHLERKNFVAGQVLFMPGDKVSRLYFLNSGAVSLITSLASGQTVEFGLVGRNSVIGGAAVLADDNARYQAVVQVDGHGYSLDVESARCFAREYSEFQTMMARHEQLILFQAQQSSACNAVHDIEQRLSRWLLGVRDVVGQDSFRLTQELMSEMLGVRRTSVTAVAQKLQQAGFISYVRGHIKIERLDALRSCACECYSTIKSQRETALTASEPLSAAR